MSWVQPDKFTDAAAVYAANADLEKPANWKLATDHKNVPITVLRHKLEAAAGG